jgi:hypothetical protein
MTPLRRTLIAALLVAAVAVLAPLGATAAPTWAPAETAAIHPGVQTYTDGAQCTANFVFTDGADTYLGQAAHCSGTGAANETDGCLAESLPLGTPVEVDGASRPGTMVYNSWLTMQADGETDPDTCAYNDFALIRLDPADAADVNPSVPAWGGPVALGGATDGGEDVFSYGNSSLRLGITQLSPKTGTSLGTDPSGWTHPVYTVTPGIPGDSGSGFLDSEGNAIGVLSTLAVAPLAGSNNVSDLASALAYARAHGGPAVQLVPGTEPFSGDLGGLLRG